MEEIDHAIHIDKEEGKEVEEQDCGHCETFAIHAVGRVMKGGVFALRVCATGGEECPESWKFWSIFILLFDTFFTELELGIIDYFIGVLLFEMKLFLVFLGDLF